LLCHWFQIMPTHLSIRARKATIVPSV